MMKCIYILVCLATLGVVVESARAIYPAQPKPTKYANQPGCYLEDHDLFLEVKKPYAPIDGTCTQYTCQSDGGQIVVFSCGVVEPASRTREDKSKPYPDCCPKPY